MIRNRSGQVHGHANGRVQRVHAHSAFKTSGIEPEKDSLGRRAPNKLSPQQREMRSLEQRAREENREAATPQFFGPSQLTAGGQIKQ
jgi:hypothetical protein